MVWRLTREESRAVLTSPDEEILDLLAAAYRVRRHHWGNEVQFHVLQNAKSGLCPEDCNYCSQSAVSDAEIAGLAQGELLELLQRVSGELSRRFETPQKQKSSQNLLAPVAAEPCNAVESDMRSGEQVTVLGHINADFNTSLIHV